MGRQRNALKKHNKKQINHDNYKDILINNKEMLREINTIRSEKHEIESYKLNKVSLSCFDDISYILHDGITGTSYAHGNKNI